MTELTEEEFLAVWDAAIPSWRARRDFLPNALKSVEAEIQRPNPLIGFAEAMQNGAEDWQTALEDQVAAFGAANDKRRRLHDQGAKLIFRWMTTGEVIALGFEKPRSIKDVPVELEPRWLEDNPQMNWYRGTLSANSLQFVEVRFITASRAEKIRAARRQAGPQRVRVADFPHSKPVGRPTVRPQILMALEALERAGELDVSASISSHFPKIRQWLAEHCESIDVGEQTPGGEVIRRVASPYLKDLRKRSETL